MPRHKKGTLVRACTKEELDQSEWLELEDIVEEYGHIFIVQRFLKAGHSLSEYSEAAYECKSLSTGEPVQLFPHEITTKKPKQPTKE